MPGTAVQGVGQFAGEIAMAPIRLSKLPADLLTGSNPIDMSGNVFQDIQAGFREYTPLVADMATGFTQAANVTGIGSQKNIIGRYQDAVAEGRVLDQALGDIANLAIVAGPIAKVLGRTATAVSAAERSAALLRNTGFSAEAPSTLSRALRPASRARNLERPPSLAGQVVERPISDAGFIRPIRMNPPDVPAPTSIPLRISGEAAPRRLPVVNESRSLRVGAGPAGTDVMMSGERGLAGLIQRRANPDMRFGVEAPKSALRLERVGERIHRVGLTAQYADPSDALLTIGAKLGGRAVRGAARLPWVKGAIARVESSPRVQRRLEAWKRRVGEERFGQQAMDSIEEANAEFVRAAIKSQEFVDGHLARLDVPVEARDVYGSVVLAQLDRAMDPLIDAWNETSDPQVRANVLAVINENRPDNATFTPEMIQAVNDYRSGNLPDGVAPVLDEGITRAQRQIDDRTARARAIGTVAEEQFGVPTRRSDGRPLADLTPAERAAAFEVDPYTGQHDVVLPFRATKVDPIRERLQGDLARLQEEELPARRAELHRTARELATTEAVRLALPEPGTNVPDDMVPGFREELVNDLVDARNEVAAALSEHLARPDIIDPALDELIGTYVRRLEQLDEDIATLKATYWDLSFEQMKSEAQRAKERPIPKLRDLDDGASVHEYGQQVRAELHQQALDEAEQFNSTMGGPRLTPPERAPMASDGAGAKRKDFEQPKDSSGVWDVWSNQSPIWQNHRSRRFYALKGWFPKVGMLADDWFDMVRRQNPSMTSWSDMQIAEAYLSAIDRVYDTNRPAHLNPDVIEVVASALDMDPEMASAALRSPTAFRKEMRARIGDQLQYLAESFRALPLDERTTFINNMRSLDELGINGRARADAFYETLGDLFDEARRDDPTIATDRDLFEHIMDVVSTDDLVRMLTEGEVLDSMLRQAEDTVLLTEQARAKLQGELDALELRKARQEVAAGAEAQVRKSLAEVAGRADDALARLEEEGIAVTRDGELVANMVDTNPTPYGSWDGGTAENVMARDELVAETETRTPPRDDVRAATSPAEKLIEQETLRRKAYDDARRDLWVTEQKIAAAERRIATLERSLDRTKQQMIYETNRRSVARMRKIVKGISTHELGGYEPSSMPDQPGRLTGLVGRIANDLGLTDLVVRLVAKERADLAKQWEAEGPTKPRPGFVDWARRTKGVDDLAGRPDYGDLLAEWQSLGDEVPVSFGEWLRERQLEAKGGAMNSAVNHLVNLAGGVDGLGNWKGALLEAVVADDLSRFLTPFFRDGLLVGREAYSAITNRFDALMDDSAYSSVMSSDVRTALIAEGKRQLEQLGRDLDTINDVRISAIPARFRTPVQEANRVVRGLLQKALEEWDSGTQEGRDVAIALARVAEQAPTSFGAFAEYSDVTPQHIIGGTTLNKGVTVRTNQVGQHTVGLQATRAERERQSGFRANTLREYARIEANEMTRIVAQVAIGHLASMDGPFVKAAYDAIPEAIAQWRAEHPGQTLRYGKLREMLEDEGWSVVEGFGDVSSTGQSRGIRFGLERPAVTIDAAANATTRTDPGMGAGRLIELDDAIYSDDLPAIRVMPTRVWNALREYQDPRSNAFLTLYDQMTQLWKTGTLAWSPAWVTYNAIGNAMMAGFSYGMGPIEIVRRLTSMRNTLRGVNEAGGLGSKRPLTTAMFNNTLSTLLPGRINAHGLSWTEKSATMSLAVPDTRLGRMLDYATNADKSRLGRITEFSYTLNEFTDNMFRSSVFLADLEKRLRKNARIPAEYLDSRGNVRTDLTPEQHAHLDQIGRNALDAQEQAVRAALNTMGDFTRLTQFERKFVKRIFPFYPWIRHQTAMALRMPLTNPLRWAWMQSLADMLADDDEGDHVNALMANMLGPVSLAAANPFNRGFLATGSEEEKRGIFDWRSVASAMNPIPKTAFQLASGIDLAAQDSYTRPADQKSIGAFGQTLNTSAATRFFGGDVKGGLGEAGFALLGMNPQTRGLRDIVLGAQDPRPRYDSGDVIPHAEAKSDNLLTQVLRAGRVPFAPVDITRQLEVARAKDEQARNENRRRLLMQSLRSGG